VEKSLPEPDAHEQELVYIRGEVITRTQTVTATTTVVVQEEHTATATHVVSVTVPATATATATVVATAVTTAVATATTPTHTAPAVRRREPEEQVKSLKMNFTARVDRLAELAHIMKFARPTDRSWDYFLAELSKLKSAIESAESVDVLKELGEKLSELERSLAVDVKSVREPIEFRAGEEVKTLTLEFRAVALGSSGAVVGVNNEFRARVDPSSVEVAGGLVKAKLSREELAKLYIGLLAASNALTREHWERLYKAAGGEALERALSKWLREEKLSAEDVWALANGATALLSVELLVNPEKIERAFEETKDFNLVNYKGLLLEGVEKLLPLHERFTLPWGAQAYEEAYRRLIEKLKRGERIEVPPEVRGRWLFHEVVTRVAQYMPLNIVYQGIYDRLRGAIGGPAAAAVASAAVVALLALVPYAGAALGPAAATVASAATSALVWSHLAVNMAAFASFLSELRDPELRQAIAQWLAEQGGWQVLAEEIAAATATGIATGVAAHLLVQKALASPRVWNKLPERVRAGLARLGVAPYQQVVEAKVVLQDTERTLSAVYDPAKRELHLTLFRAGEAEVRGVKRVSREFLDKVQKFLRARGIGVDVGTPDNPNIEALRLFVVESLKYLQGSAVSREGLEDILNHIDDFAEILSTLKVSPEAFRGVADVRYLDRVGAFLMARPSEGEVLVAAKDKVYRVAIATKDMSTLVKYASAKRSLAQQMNDISSSIAYQVVLSRAVKIPAGARVGDFTNVAHIAVSNVDEPTAMTIINAVKALYHYIRQAPTGGVPVQQIVQQYGGRAAPVLEDLLRAVALLELSNVETVIVAVPVGNQLHIALLVPQHALASASSALAKALQEGAKPSSIGLVEVPVHTVVHVPVTATVTAAAPTVVSLRVPTAILEPATLAEESSHITETVPIVATVTAVARVVAPLVKHASVVEVSPLVEVPVSAVETVPVVATETATAPAVVPLRVPTAVLEPVALGEEPVHSTETVPVVATEAVRVPVLAPYRVFGVALETGVLQLETVTKLSVVVAPLTVVLPPPPKPAPPVEEEPVPVAPQPKPGIAPAPQLPAPARGAAKPEKPAELEREIIVL